MAETQALLGTDSCFRRFYLVVFNREVVSGVDVASPIHDKTLVHSRSKFRFLLDARWSFPFRGMRTSVTPAFSDRTI